MLVYDWPAGKKTIQKATGIAGNVATPLTVPTGKRWLLLNLSVTLTTDVTVANRKISFQTRDGADAIKFSNYGSNITASTTDRRSFSREVSNTGDVINSLGLQLLTADEDWNIFIGSGQAGDTYDYLAEYLELPA